MADKQMTPWFPAKVKPAHTGVYEVRFDSTPDVVGYAFWTGDRWGCMSSTPEKAESISNAFVDWASQNKRWRGFTEPQT